MRKTLQLTTAISLAATLALALPAVAQQWDHHQGPPGGGHGPGGHGPGGPGFHGPGPGGHGPGGPGFHGPGGPGFRGPGGHGPGGFHHALGERGYSFRGPGGVRREIRLFSPREREIWLGGHWHHDVRFGRLGWWYEVNGAWYFYDEPFDGPPTYVSEYEYYDPDIEGPPAVVVAPPAVVVVPPVVCVGPLCVR